MRLPRLRRRHSVERLRRGVYVIPSLFTVANLLCGYWALVEASNGRFRQAAVLILVAIVADILDGRIARLTGATSSFGAAYDSIADVVSFGAAPAFLAYCWVLHLQPDLGLFASFLFLVGGSIRLARFNTTTHDLSHFQGLPIPAAAGSVAVLVLVTPRPFSHPAFPWLVVGFVLSLALLMVSTLPYRSFKDLDLRRQRPATTLFVLALALALLILKPFLLSVLAAVYVLSAPLSMLLGKARRGARPPAPAVETSTDAGTRESPPG